MLSIKDLTYHPTAATHPILKAVNLQLAPQQLGLVVGASGSGKSTLLEILSGLVEPTKGSVLWGDQKLSSEDLQKLAGLVFQFPERHFCGGTILEELRLGHPELGSDRVETALQEVGLDHLSLKASPYDLSGGQQRRLALAVQLIRQPNVLLLDEPTAGLDWSMKQQLVSLLAKLKKDWTLFVVTHDARDLLDIADICWTINQGTVSRETLSRTET